MRIIKKDLNIDFLGKQVYAFTISGLLILAGLISIAMRQGLTYGIDFRGGTNVQIKFKDAVSLEELRGLLNQQTGGSAAVQTFGKQGDHEVLVTLPVESSLGSGNELGQNLQKILGGKFPQLEIRRMERTGPKVGAELKSSTLQAILIAFGLILIYVSFRFQWFFGVGAIVAVIHDVVITVGFFSIFDKEITLPVVAALLTLIGFSINDTIVILDRVRENQGKYSRKSQVEIINISLNETLNRTILTSFTVFLVVATLFFLGGDIIHDFAFAMLIGVVTGTYSSIYIACPIVVFLTKKTTSTPAKTSTPPKMS